MLWCELAQDLDWFIFRVYQKSWMHAKWTVVCYNSWHPVFYELLSHSQPWWWSLSNCWKPNSVRPAATSRARWCFHVQMAHFSIFIKRKNNPLCALCMLEFVWSPLKHWGQNICKWTYSIFVRKKISAFSVEFWPKRNRRNHPPTFEFYMSETTQENDGNITSVNQRFRVEIDGDARSEFGSPNQ